MSNAKVELGHKVRDIITGLEGIAVARVVYLNGCVQYGIRAKITEKGKPMEDAHYVDEGQIKVVGQGVRPKPATRSRHSRRPPGGPSRDVPHG